MPYTPENIKAEAFIAGDIDLYNVAREYPDFRMIRFSQLDAVKRGLARLGYRVRIRYRGPHRQLRDTLKRNARNFTVYFQSK